MTRVFRDIVTNPIVFQQTHLNPDATLRTPTATVSLALKMRTEGMGIRVSGRVLHKSHSTIIVWQKRVAAKETDWSPPAPVGGDITVEGDELYTRCAVNFFPKGSLRAERLTF